jgi:hypothetical protein
MGDASSIRGDRAIVTLWTHRFYKKPEGRMKTALLQQEVNCKERSTREGRYIDFDVAGVTIESGDNSETSKQTAVAPGTVGDLIVTFACASPAYRKANFLSIDGKVDYEQVANFYLEDGEIVSAPAK